MRREKQAPHFTLFLSKIESGYFVHILFPYLRLQISSSIKIIKWPTAVSCLQNKQLATPEPWMSIPPPHQKAKFHYPGCSLLVHGGMDYTNSQSKVNCCQELLPTWLGEDCILIMLWGPLQPTPEQMSHRHIHTLLHCWGQRASDVWAPCFLSTP